jgi:hypothetical protein
MVAKLKVGRTGQSRMSVGFPPDHMKRLEQIASQNDRSVAWLIRYAVKLFLDEFVKGQLSLDLEPRPKVG